MTQRRQARKPKQKRASPRRTRAARPAVVSSVTYYDPVRKCVVDAQGNTVTPVAMPTVEPRAHAHADMMQRPLVLTREQHVERLANTKLLYACETATPETIVRLAATAGCSIAELEWRRRAWVNPPAMAGVPIAETWCGRNAKAGLDDVPSDRRLCLSCPVWMANPDATPF